MSGLLAGIRVIELGRMVAAPWCGQLLADLGADVIKVELAGEGDQMRRYAPFVTDADGKATQESSYFTAFNRGKRSLTVDFSKPEGREIVRRLAQSADIFIENYKTGDLARYGLDAASLRARHPDLIYLSITGFGQTGPYAGRPGLDSVFQCMGGLVSVTGEPDAPPTKIGLTVCDLVTGLYGVIACLAALRAGLPADRRDPAPGGHRYAERRTVRRVPLRRRLAQPAGSSRGTLPGLLPRTEPRRLAGRAALRHRAAALAVPRPAAGSPRRRAGSLQTR
jgi:hypothetical protein